MDLYDDNEMRAARAAYLGALEKLAGRSTLSRPSPKPAESDSTVIPMETKWACAHELLSLNAITPAQARALVKQAEVSAHDAQRSFDRLDTLERNKPTLRQGARYGAVGAVGGAGAGALGNLIEHGSALRGATPKAKVLGLAANAAKGAVAGGALPLLRSHLDRRAEVGTLKTFMRENAGTSNV